MTYELPYALLKVLAVFFIIVAANRFKIDLGLSIIIGTLMLGPIFGLGIITTLESMAKSITEPLTLMLILLVTLILVLNQLMSKSGAQQDLVKHLSLFVNNVKISLFALPALIGLLPMPGGAFFSAPMVEEVSKDLDVTQEWRVLVNYWFRHIWEFWWPMYPGVILAVSLSGIPLFSYVLLMFIFTPVALIAGYFLLLKPLHTNTEKMSDSEFFNKFKMFLYHAMPILLILGVMVLFSVISALLENPIMSKSNMSQYLPMFAGLLASGFWVYTKGKLKPIHIVHAIINRKTTMLLLLIVSVMAYKKVLSDCGAIVQMNAEMQALNIPLMAIAVALPLVSGLVMGIAVGFVGASFPVLLGLISGSNDYLFYIVIAYMSGYTGMMISPIHMCLVLTKNHFTGAKMGSIYGKLIPLCAITFIFGLIYSLAIKILH